MLGSINEDNQPTALTRIMPYQGDVALDDPQMQRQNFGSLRLISLKYPVTVTGEEVYIRPQM